jgi:hypothetical protein
MKPWQLSQDIETRRPVWIAPLPSAFPWLNRSRFHDFPQRILDALNRFF